MHTKLSIERITLIFSADICDSKNHQHSEG